MILYEIVEGYRPSEASQLLFVMHLRIHPPANP